MPTSALRALADLPGVADAADAVREASTALRWHQGLRRRWREARAEAAVRSAAANADLEGAPVDLAELRLQVASGGWADAEGAGPALALAAWRAHVHVGTLMGDLGGKHATVPAREMLAALHRDLTADLARRGVVDDAVVGRPRTGDPVADARLAALCAVVDADGAPALVRVAVAHAEIATLRPFGAADGLLARAVARLLAARSGLEPTGVAVPDVVPAADPDAYRAALAAYASGTTAGVVAWIEYQARCLTEGAREGAAVASAVLAGRP